MHYFPNEMNDTDHIAWVRNLFDAYCSKLSLSSEDESTLIELSFDRYLIRIKVWNCWTVWLQISKWIYCTVREGIKSLIATWNDI